MRPVETLVSNATTVDTMDTRTSVYTETMLLHEMGPQLKLPIKVTKGSMPLQCNTYFPQILAI